MKNVFITLSLLVVCIGILMAVGCSSTGFSHVSGEKFIQYAKTMEQMNSAYSTYYIGCTQDRAYVELSGLHKVLQIHPAMVYWTELSNLPPDLTKQLREGHPPWIPWQERTTNEDANTNVATPPESGRE